MDVCGLGVLCCLRRYQQPRNTQPREIPQVQLDTGQMGITFQTSPYRETVEWAMTSGQFCILIVGVCFVGNEVVIVKSGKRICGSGAALANTAVLQNKCYFEIKIQSGGG